MGRSKNVDWTNKATKDSDKCSKYFYKLMTKKATGGKLTQKERVFLELYTMEFVQGYHFVVTMRPRIIDGNAIITELRNDGFVIPNPTLEHVEGQVHSKYKLIKGKEYIVEPVKRSFFRRLFCYD
jgi:hypothetical protein